MRYIRIFAKNMGNPYYEPTIVLHDEVIVCVLVIQLQFLITYIQSDIVFVHEVHKYACTRNYYAFSKQNGLEVVLCNIKIYFYISPFTITAHCFILIECAKYLGVSIGSKLSFN